MSWWTISGIAHQIYRGCRVRSRWPDCLWRAERCAAQLRRSDGGSSQAV